MSLPELPDWQTWRVHMEDDWVHVELHLKSNDGAGTGTHGTLLENNCFNAEGFDHSHLEQNFVNKVEAIAAAVLKKFESDNMRRSWVRQHFA